MQRFNCTNLPVQEENKEDYRKAITRMRGCGIRVEACWPGDIITYQEQEIKRYRTEVERLREMKEDTKRDENVQIEGCMCELAAEGIARDDGVVYLKLGDTIILKRATMSAKKTMDLLGENLREKGIDVIILPCDSDVVGIVGGNA